MYNVSQAFKDNIIKNGRQFKSSVTIRDTTFDDNNIIEMSLSEDVNPADSFMIGSVASSSFDITIVNPPDTLIFESAKVCPVISLFNGSIFEDVPLGVFWVDKIEKGKNTIKLSCFDNMIKLEKAYFSDLSYPATIQAVVQEICTKAGVEFASTLPNIQIDKIDGYTYREAIGFIASFLGEFARFNRQGKLEITSYIDSGVFITADSYYKNPTTAEKAFTIGKLTCKAGENIITSGSSGNEIQFENPIMTQSQLDSIYNTLKNLSYMPYKMDWQGNHALQAGDKITITDDKNNTYTTLLMQQKITYKGGLSASASAVGKTAQAQEFNSGGSIKNKVDRLVIEQANIKVLLAETATIEDLTAINAKIDNFVANTAQIADLAVTSAKIANATITSTQIALATITSANIANATIDTANIKIGAITNALIGAAAIDTANIKTGAITTALIATANITTALIADGSIINAKIADGTIDVAKIKDATITSAKIANATITSANILDGTIVNADIANATITGAKIADATIGNANIIDATITGAKIANATITNAQIANATIGTAQIALGAITTALIKDSAIGTAQIADGSITDAKIVTLTASKITAGTIDAGVINVTNLNAANITVGTINGQRIGDGSIINSKIADDAVDAAKIKDLCITANLIAGNTITGDKIVADAITSREIASKTITANEIASGTITASEIAAGTITATNIASGTITTAQLASTVGTGLDISSNTSITSRVTSATYNAGINNVTQLAQAYATGKMLYADPIFAVGNNGIGVYNNSGGGTVTATRITSPTGCPSTSGYCLQIQTTGTASPGNGGFYFGNASRANALFIARIIANIPVGLNLNFASNSYGTGGSQAWLTPTVGTGTWTEYVCRVVCGSSGTFSSTNYFYVSGGTPTITWHVSFATVYDITDIQGIVSTINQTPETIGISASKISISGSVTLSNWSHASDATKIDGGDIYTGSITATQIKAGTITATSGVIANAAITGAIIANATITSANIANATITAVQIANATITNAQIANGTIGTAQIANLAVTTGLIADGAITNAKIANATITAAQIADATITSAKIVSIDAGKITTGTMVADRILGGTLTLGGSVNGVFNLKDSSGKLICSANTSGMVFTDGKLKMITDVSVDPSNPWMIPSNYSTLLNAGGIDMEYNAPSAAGSWWAKLVASSGLDMGSSGGTGSNPYIFKVGPGVFNSNISRITVDKGLDIYSGTTKLFGIDSSGITPTSITTIVDAGGIPSTYKNSIDSLGSHQSKNGTTIAEFTNDSVSSAQIKASKDIEFWLAGYKVGSFTGADLGLHINNDIYTKGFPVWSNYNVNGYFGASGYLELPNGFLLQWGNVESIPLSNGAGTATGSFAKPFPHACLRLLCNIRAVDGGTDIAHLFTVINTGNSTSQCSFKITNIVNTWGSAAALQYIAIGY